MTYAPLPLYMIYIYTRMIGGEMSVKIILSLKSQRVVRSLCKESQKAYDNTYIWYIVFRFASLIRCACHLEEVFIAANHDF